MKKLLILLAISMLPACNSRQATQDLTELQQQEVKVQSAQGVNSYMEKYVGAMFNYSDKNKDGVINPEEVNNNTMFDLADKNKDGKLDLTEFKKAFFIANINIFNKEKIREILVDGAHQVLKENVFTYSALKKTYEGFMTKEQFLKYGLYLTKEPVAVFYVADKNNDGKLNFSEFEDCFFALGKASLDKISNNTNQQSQVLDNNFAPEPEFEGN